MSKELVEIELPWYFARDTIFSNWNLKNCVYAYFVPTYDYLIPYIGEAVYSAVRDRCRDHDTDGVNEKTCKDFGVRSFNVLIASPIRKDGRPVTTQLIHDIESALIYYCQPSINDKKKRSINVNYPLYIESTGEWPFIRRTVYHDGNVVKDPSEALQEAMLRARMAGVLPGLFSSHPLLPGLNQTPPPVKNESNNLGDILSLARAFREPGILNMMNMVERAKSRK